MCPTLRSNAIRQTGRRGSSGRSLDADLTASQVTTSPTATIRGRAYKMPTGPRRTRVTRLRPTRWYGTFRSVVTGPDATHIDSRHELRIFGRVHDYLACGLGRSAPPHATGWSQLPGALSSAFQRHFVDRDEWSDLVGAAARYRRMSRRGVPDSVRQAEVQLINRTASSSPACVAISAATSEQVRRMASSARTRPAASAISSAVEPDGSERPRPRSVKVSALTC